MDTPTTTLRIIVFPAPAVREALQVELQRVELLMLDDEPPPEPEADADLDWRLQAAATK